jgi:hypothetical protein
MKDLIVTFMGAMVSLLLVRYYPYVSKKLLLEYISAVYLSFRSGQFINNDVANLTNT